MGLRMHQKDAIAIESQTVTLQFAGMVADEPFACGQAYELGAPATAMAPLDFRFYVSEVALLDADGNEVPLILQQDGKWQHQNVALIDFEDKSGACANGTVDTRAQVVGTVPAGDYSGVKFTLGVPFGLNHVDSTLAPSPLNLTSLWWNWNFGYKFARIDLTPATEMAGASAAQTKQHAAEEFSGFAFHLGSVGCQMDATQAPVVCS
ncbi:MAG: MbnP family copper-binding protein, partial [Cyanobacteria bacterium P01_H01_bin.105]